MSPTLMTVVLGSFFNPSQACGGFFCEQIPIDQAAERIVFAIDEEQGEVEVHVQISYEGAAEDFAWVVPTPTQPRLVKSSQDLFDRLSPRTMPLWQPTFEVEGNCKNGGNRLFATADMATAEAAFDDGGTNQAGGVNVVAQQTIGAFEATTLQARTSEDLLTYLQDNGFSLPDDLSPALDPYIAEDSYFVALKLRSGADTGDITPIGLAYPSTTPQIPLQLTAIAATPDMRLQPYVLSKARAVPDNYLHVRVNQLAIDWLAGGNNYPDVITRAADEAGGQAFATDFAGPIDDAMRVMLDTPPESQLDNMRKTTGTVAFVNQLFTIGIQPNTTAVSSILARHILVPEGVDPVNYFGCVECFGDPQPTVDADATVNDLISNWLEPMAHLDELFESHTYITRMTSSMSAEEMDADPLFVLNPDMPDVAQVRTARIVTECSPAYFEFEAPRRLELPDGTFMYLPPSAGTGDFEGFTADLGDVGTINALFIEDTTSAGAPAVLTDRSADLDAALELHNATYGPNGCGGCQQSSPGPMGWLLLPLLGLLRRRD
ncbi:MAG: DUF2330 domain-containing protein [Myxococcota bacterium]